VLQCVVSPLCYTLFYVHIAFSSKIVEMDDVGVNGAEPAPIPESYVFEVSLCVCACVRCVLMYVYVCIMRLCVWGVEGIDYGVHFCPRLKWLEYYLALKG
jgi:hypothetical protein